MSHILQKKGQQSHPRSRVCYLYTILFTVALNFHYFLNNVHLSRWSLPFFNSVSMAEPLFFRECARLVVTNIDMKGPFLFKHSFKVANNGQMLEIIHVS